MTMFGELSLVSLALVVVSTATQFEASFAIGGGILGIRDRRSDARDKLQDLTFSYNKPISQEKVDDFIEDLLVDRVDEDTELEFEFETNETATVPIFNETSQLPNGTAHFPVSNGTAHFPVSNETTDFPLSNGTAHFPSTNATGGFLVEDHAENTTAFFASLNGTGNWTLSDNMTYFNLTWSDLGFENRSSGNWTPGEWLLGNWTFPGVSVGNWSVDFSNKTGDFSVSSEFINGTVSYVNGTLSGRRLGTFYRNQRNYVRVANEAVDLRLDWGTDEQLIGGREKYFINPGMIFVKNEDGTTQWVRAIRFHSTAGYSNGVTAYQGSPVYESIWVYYTSILLGSELYTGDLSGGFDDESISRWGIQSGGPLSVADNHMMSNEDSYHMWEDICERPPGYLAEKHSLTRIRTTGAEDPKLFVLPSSMNERSKWAVTFSSYPPFHSIEAMSSLDKCKWSDYSKFQMYIAPGGEQLASGIASPAHRLSCGNMISHEKNWIAFEYDDELYYVQNVQPHVVVKVNDADGSCEKAFETSSPYLAALSDRVSVRGSATAYRYSDDEYIALLHTHDDFSREPYSTRAYTFEAFPPFRVLRVSKPLPLQSSGLAFASSLTLYEDKIMVGYGVADRASRMMVMSRGYLEEQFESDCDGSVDRLVGDSGDTCAEKVIGLMLGEELMPPRRAMISVGTSFIECSGLLDKDRCKPEMVLKVSHHNNAADCNEALARTSNGITCSARIKWGIKNAVEKSEEEVFRSVAEEFSVCRDVVSLGCSKDDLRYPESTCQPTLFNSYETLEPAILLSMTHANRGNLESMIACSGISAAHDACEEKNVEICLEEGQFHLVQAVPVGADRSTAHHTVQTIRAAAAAVSRRRITAVSPRVILHTRNPLEIVFDDIMSALAGNDLVDTDNKLDIYTFQELSRSVENHALIMRTLMESALRNIQDWQVMRSFIDHPFYDVMMVTDEELSNRLLQPAIIAEMSRRFGLLLDRNTILDGLQASETLYTKSVHPDSMKSTEFFLESSALRLQYICHLMEMAPMFLQTTIEQGYGSDIGLLTQYCVGFDEEWIYTAGNEIFQGFSETL